MTETLLKSQQAFGGDGWQPAKETWVYASAYTFTVAGVDVTDKYPVGTKIKLRQTTFKYFYVVDNAFSTDTTITVIAGENFTIANAAITEPFYSYATTPQKFPNGFTLPDPVWTTSGNPFTNDPTGFAGRFTMQGQAVQVWAGAKAANPNGGTGNYIMTFPANILPLVGGYAGGYAKRAGSVTIFGFLNVADNEIRVYKYDGTELVGNDHFFGGTGVYNISAI